MRKPKICVRFILNVSLQFILCPFLGGQFFKFFASQIAPVLINQLFRHRHVISADMFKNRTNKKNEQNFRRTRLVRENTELNLEKKDEHAKEKHPQTNPDELEILRHFNVFLRAYVRNAFISIKLMKTRLFEVSSCLRERQWSSQCMCERKVVSVSPKRLELP